jgi:Putative beta-lactamase-inhibitor-like, PepSY-like
MKNSIFVVFVLIMASTTSFAQKNIPAVVKTAFEKQYPQAKSVKWEKENGAYEAGFKVGKVDNSVLLDSKGSILETEVEIETTQLPAGILAYVTKNYAAKSVKGAAKIDSKKEGILYEVEVAGKDVLFNDKGEFVRETKD